MKFSKLRDQNGMAFKQIEIYHHQLYQVSTEYILTLMSAFHYFLYEGLHRYLFIVEIEAKNWDTQRVFAVVSAVSWPPPDGPPWLVHSPESSMHLAIIREPSNVSYLHNLSGGGEPPPVPLWECVAIKMVAGWCLLLVINTSADCDTSAPREHLDEDRRYVCWEIIAWYFRMVGSLQEILSRMFTQRWIRQSGQLI